eukprot:2133104-Pleurochrysis_carterae.AAC.1
MPSSYELFATFMMEVSRSGKNTRGGRGLVKKSALSSAPLTKGTVISCYSTFSRQKRDVRECVLYVDGVQGYMPNQWRLYCPSITGLALPAETRAPRRTLAGRRLLSRLRMLQRSQLRRRTKRLSPAS